jgi:hypothetical protein
MYGSLSPPVTFRGATGGATGPVIMAQTLAIRIHSIKISGDVEGKITISSNVYVINHSICRVTETRVNNKIFSHNPLCADKDCSNTNTTREAGELITVSKSLYDVERRSYLETASVRVLYSLLMLI